MRFINVLLTYLLTCWILSLNKEDVASAKYESNNLGGIWCDRCDSDTNWSSCCNVICVCWMAWQRSVTDRLSIRGLSGGIKSVLEIIITTLHCFKWKVCWPMCVCDFVQLLLWIRSVPMSNACVRCAFVHHIVQPHVTAQLRNITSAGIESPLLGLFSYLFPFRNTRLFM